VESFCTVLSIFNILSTLLNNPVVVFDRPYRALTYDVRCLRIYKPSRAAFNKPSDKDLLSASLMPDLCFRNMQFWMIRQICGLDNITSNASSFIKNWAKRQKNKKNTKQTKERSRPHHLRSIGRAIIRTVFYIVRTFFL